MGSLWKRGFALVGILVLVGFLRLRVWDAEWGNVVGVEVGVGSGSGLDDVLREDTISDPLSLLSFSSSFLIVVGEASLFACDCAGLRRGDLNGLESVEAALSTRRRFPVRLTEVIVKK